MTILKYRQTVIRKNFVCFHCRYRIRFGKYSTHTPSCPLCHRLCDNLGDRCTVPPKNKIKEWQSLEQDYRTLQRKIAQAYICWKGRLKADLQKHMRLAEASGFSDIVSDDLFWLNLLEELDELPQAYYAPYACNWTAQIRPEASYSNLGSKQDTETAQRLLRLQSLPANKERQALIDDLLYRERSLLIDDLFGQIRHQFYIVRQGNRQYFHEYSKQKCFKNLLYPYR